jgi:hypothetical protein
MENTKFTPGQSGNPNGRPKDKTPATLLRKSIAEELPDIVKTLIAQAKKGDVQAAKILLDRVCPPLKPQALPVNIPSEGTLADQGNSVIKETLSGHVPPDIGAALISALAAQGKLIDLEEMADRLARIEKQLRNRK